MFLGFSPALMLPYLLDSSAASFTFSIYWQRAQDLLQYYSVLQSTTPELRCTTKYYSSTTLHYKVLQCTTPYDKVLQSTTPVLQRTTPVLLCTTKYYSITTPYYKVLLQFSGATSTKKTSKIQTPRQSSWNI